MMDESSEDGDWKHDSCSDVANNRKFLRGTSFPSLFIMFMVVFLFILLSSFLMPWCCLLFAICVFLCSLNNYLVRKTILRSCYVYLGQFFGQVQNKEMPYLFCASLGGLDQVFVKYICFKNTHTHTHKYIMNTKNKKNLECRKLQVSGHLLGQNLKISYLGLSIQRWYQFLDFSLVVFFPYVFPSGQF